MPSWGILKSSKTKRKSAQKVHFSMQKDHESDSRGGPTDVQSEAAYYHHQAQDDLGQPPYYQGHDHPPDLSHSDVEDEEERECLRHLDHLGLTLEKTFKDVESIDAYVKKLREDFNHENVPEQRYISCICSAKMARAVCCKKQIKVWQQLQHDIQELCCHHHQHHQEVVQPCKHSVTEPPEQASDSDSSSISTTGSQDTGDVDFIVSQLNKMVLFNSIRHRLDPSADTRAFVEHWILQGLQYQH